METPEEKRLRHEWMAIAIERLTKLGFTDEEIMAAGPEFVNFWWRGVEPLRAVTLYFHMRARAQGTNFASFTDINNDQYLRQNTSPAKNEHWAGGDGVCKHHGRRFMCDDCSREGRYFFMPHEHDRTGPYGRWANVRDTDFIKKFFTKWMALQRDELSDAEKFN